MIYVARNRELLTPATVTEFTSTYIPPTDPKCIYAIIQALAGDIRFTIDGTDATTILGLKLTEDSSVEVWGMQDLTNFSCIRDNGSGTVEVIYMGNAD